MTTPFFETLHTSFTDGVKLCRSPTTKLMSGSWSRHINIGTCKVAVARPSATRTLSSIDMNVIASGPYKIQASNMSSINDFANILSLFFFLRLFSGRNSLTGIFSTYLIPSIESPLLGKNLT